MTDHDLAVQEMLSQINESRFIPWICEYLLSSFVYLYFYYYRQILIFLWPLDIQDDNPRDLFSISS